MKDLEQIRAAAALSFWSDNERARGVAGGNVVSKLGSLIIRDGLLSTLAFCAAKGDGHERLGNEVCRYVFERLSLPGQTTLGHYVATLAGQNSEKLRLATQEALRYVDYLKRFEPKNDQANAGGRP